MSLPNAPSTPRACASSVAGVVLEDVEREFVRQALEMTQGNQTRAARLVSLTRDELRYRAKKFDLAPKIDAEPA